LSRRFRKRDTRPILRLTPREQRPFEQQITKSGHWLRCVNAHTWWGRFRTEDASWNGPEFRTEAGQKFRAACVARVLAGLADDPRYLTPGCGEERCIAPAHQLLIGKP
jgi:hypothetical protein